MFKETFCNLVIEMIVFSCAFYNLLLPEMNPIVKGGVWIAASSEHEYRFQNSHQDGTSI